MRRKPIESIPLKAFHSVGGIFHDLHDAACDHLHFLCQPRSAGFGAGRRLAHHGHPAERADVGSGPCADDGVLFHHRLQPQQRAAHPCAGYRQADGVFRRADGRSPFGLLRRAALRMAGSASAIGVFVLSVTQTLLSVMRALLKYVS